MTRTILLLATVLAGACGPGFTQAETVQWQIDPSPECGTGPAGAVVRGLALWTESCGLTIEGVTEADADASTVRVCFTSDPTLLDHHAGYTHGTWPGSVTIDLDPAQENLDALAAHEMGHALGLQHVVEEESLMWPHPYSLALGPADVAEASEVGLDCEVRDEP